MSNAKPCYSIHEGSQDFQCIKEAETTFDEIKEKFISCVALNSIDCDSSIFQLVTDASLVAIGAALHQKSDGVFRPIAFFSKKLSAPQQSYSAYDRELFAVYLSVLHFRPIIEDCYKIRPNLIINN